MNKQSWIERTLNIRLLSPHVHDLSFDFRFWLQSGKKKGKNSFVVVFQYLHLVKLIMITIPWYECKGPKVISEIGRIRTSVLLTSIL